MPTTSPRKNFALAGIASDFRLFSTDDCLASMRGAPEVPTSSHHWKSIVTPEGREHPS